MAEGLILEFDGLTREPYDAVNASPGIDVVTRAGDCPAGLLVHAGGATPAAGSSARAFARIRDTVRDTGQIPRAMPSHFSHASPRGVS
jgi:hypothetical protein